MMRLTKLAFLLLSIIKSIESFRSNIKRFHVNSKYVYPSNNQKLPAKPSVTQSTKLYLSADENPLISAAFNLATFGPQPFWLLMILLPNTGITKAIMGNWSTIIFFSLVHLFIVGTSISQPDGTAPIEEFTKVFDPSGDPLGGMLGMMKYSNFVSEEWSHVLTWDLFVGRLIWLDGIRRGIFTPHSVLFCNLIGPPGLLLHVLTCLITQKGLPTIDLPDTNDTKDITDNSLINGKKKKNTPAVTTPVKTFQGYQIVTEVFPNLLSNNEVKRQKIIDLCDDNIVWEYTNEKETIMSKASVTTMLQKRASKFPKDAKFVLEKVADGAKSCGFTWYLEQKNQKGLRGIMYIEFNENNKISYIREVAEPLFKPGPATAKLLEAVVKEAVKKDPSLAIRPPPPSKRMTTSASDLVAYLWNDINGSDKNMTLDMFDTNIIYEDLNFETPFMGLSEVSAFIDEFDIPGIKFIPERISEGQTGCCFTWRVELAGVEASTRGVSFYSTNSEGTKVTYIRDIAEPAIKPAPLQEIASIVNPGLRRFKPLPLTTTTV